MSAEFWAWLMQVAAWGAAVAWCVGTTEAIRGLPLVQDLTHVEWDVQPEAMPSLAVVVTARDEAAKIAATLDALMQADYTNLQVLAVNDRSGDATGALMDDCARRHPHKLRVLHITELPEGWLGKTHAMQRAVEASESEYVLFTDADVLFSPSVLRRSLAYAQRERLDHMVTVPTMQLKSWGEGVVIGIFQVVGFWAVRAWKVSDPASKRDVVGIGAFNMLRRDALETLGGLEPQRFVVVEDVTIGRRVKAAGLRQGVALAPGMVQLHWAMGARGLVRVLSKNMFSAFNFNPALALGACALMAAAWLGPLVGLAWKGTVLPGLLVCACISVVYRLYGASSGVPAKYAWSFPLGVLAFLYAIVRSVLVTWKDGGVKWRGTLYPLKELRRHNSPWKWMKNPRG